MTDWIKNPHAKGFSRDVLEDPYGLTATDTQRLDWLVNNAIYVQPCKPLATLMFDIPEGKSLRAAIDAALAAVDRGA